MPQYTVCIFILGKRNSNSKSEAVDFFYYDLSEEGKKRLIFTETYNMPDLVYVF